MSGFGTTVARELRGERVRVVSNDGQVFGGWVERINTGDRHVLLRGAKLVNDGGSHDRGTVFIAHADSIEQTQAETIRQVALENVRAAPYHSREFEPEENEVYIDEVRREGWAESFPVVRPRGGRDGPQWFEIVEGHKRLWAAAQAGLDVHPVEIVQLRDLPAAKRFVYDHLPGRRHATQDDRHENYYDDDQVVEAIEALVDQFGSDALEIDRVAYNVERLDLDLIQDTEAVDG